ncbi:HlyD family secretion protein [Tissierella praeacuta DSM 18095]|uniref:HlyD family secretion protein n=1 Tax=Tissierella praeacuta DSM 18095 TaxID=1123404 RepID=A0A1M4T8B2_9FIRM|nr:efflux RND transporter periplasmic adaptor subunit [Tissierella praeacuta]SHE40675.1 HlyD family secretion protein [Tissierella praeacuta DSM 18095]SUP04860.1 Macrolide-specific efflux protein macA precursor [Tissierella praeacuta]
MKKKVIIAIIFITIIITVSYIKYVKRFIEVNTATVEKGNITKYVEELGVVKSENQVNIYSATTGMVSKVLVDIGHKVKKGDVLVILDKDEIIRDMEQLSNKREAILAEYNEAKQPIDNKEILKLELEIEDLEKKLANLRRILDNKKTLYNEGAISYEEYQEALLQMESETINLEKVKLDLEIIKKPISQDIVTKFETQLRQLDIQEKDLEKTYKDSIINSNIDGIVFGKFVEEGSYIQQGTCIMDIGNIDKLYIESDILVEDVMKVVEGAKVHITNKDLNIVDLEGTVKNIHPYAFAKTSDLGIQQKRVKVDIEINGNEKGLRPGYDLEVKIITEEVNNTLIVPKKALFIIDGKDYVFIDDNGKARLREVITGIENDKDVQIIQGLKEGEILILSPHKEIREGIRIKGI